MNGAVSKVKNKFISHLTRAKRTPLAVAALPVCYVLITVLQCVRPCGDLAETPRALFQRH